MRRYYSFVSTLVSMTILFSAVFNYELVYWAQFDKIWKCDCGETKEDKLIFTPNLKDLPEQEIIIWKRHGLK